MTLTPMTGVAPSCARTRPMMRPVFALNPRAGYSVESEALSSAMLTVAMPGLLYVGLVGYGSMNGYIVSTCSAFGQAASAVGHWSGPACSAPGGRPQAGIGWLR